MTLYPSSFRIIYESYHIMQSWIYNIIKRQHVQVISKHWSSTNRMSSKQNQIPTNHYPFPDEIGNNYIHTTISIEKEIKIIYYEFLKVIVPIDWKWNFICQNKLKNCYLSDWNKIVTFILMSQFYFNPRGNNFLKHHIIR